jgi:hypothetical protein
MNALHTTLIAGARVAGAFLFCLAWIYLIGWSVL